MTSQSILRSRLAIFAATLAFAGAAFAQAAAGNSSASSPPSTTTTTTTTTTPSTIELPSVPATSAPTVSAPAATTSTTSQTTADPNAIGATSLTRLDTSNTAFEKLAPDRAFLTPADVGQLPGFGDAFAKADRDADGRLDRTEFADAWAYYIGEGTANAPSVTTSTPTQ